MKAMVAPGTIFEELGLNYIGPIDGHNLKELKDVISNLREFEGPQFLHVITKKGAPFFVITCKNCGPSNSLRLEITSFNSLRL